MEIKIPEQYIIKRVEFSYEDRYNDPYEGEDEENGTYPEIKNPAHYLASQIEILKNKFKEEIGLEAEDKDINVVSFSCINNCLRSIEIYIEKEIPNPNYEKEMDYVLVAINNNPALKARLQK